MSLSNTISIGSIVTVNLAQVSVVQIGRV